MSCVVYVDDEPALCRVFRLILRRTGATVHAFTNPVEALAFIEQTAVDVIISDYRMPEMTGLELLGCIDRDVPFFMVSGELSIEALVTDEPRVTAVLVKPFRPEELLDLLQPWIG
jgi:CheY-like chemotaxis protein